MSTYTEVFVNIIKTGTLVHVSPRHVPHMGVHTRPAFLHLQEAVLHPILQLQNTRSSGLLGADRFSEPTGRSTSARISQPHCVQLSSFP